MLKHLQRPQTEPQRLSTRLPETNSREPHLPRKTCDHVPLPEKPCLRFKAGRRGQTQTRSYVMKTPVGPKSQPDIAHHRHKLGPASTPWGENRTGIPMRPRNPALQSRFGLCFLAVRAPRSVISPRRIELQHRAGDLDVVSGLKALSLERLDDAKAAQAGLDVGHGVFVLDVKALEQALDSPAADGEGAGAGLLDGEAVLGGGAVDHVLGELAA